METHFSSPYGLSSLIGFIKAAGVAEEAHIMHDRFEVPSTFQYGLELQ